MSEKTKQQLEDAVNAAEAVVTGIYQQIRDRKFTIDQEFGEALTSANLAAHDARKALQEFRDAEAIANANPPYPVGTVVAEWEGVPEFKRTATNTRQLTGVTGIVEIITRDSTHPENIAYYSQAKIGECVIRLRKKNGTTGAKYIQPGNSGWGTGQCRMWRPLGVDLNAELHAGALAKAEAERQAKLAAEAEVLRSAAEVFGL